MIADSLYVTSLTPIFTYLIPMKFKLDKKIKKIENMINASRENCCLLLFFKKADLMAIIKSSLLDAIYLNTL